MLKDSRYNNYINDMTHATLVYVFSEGNSFKPTSTRCEIPC